MTDKRDLDDFRWMDVLQDETDAAITDAIPFEPDVELREETAHEEPVDVAPPGGFAQLEVSDVVDPLADLDIPALEGEDG